MMNTHPLDFFESNTAVASTANNRRGKKALQLILSKAIYTVGGETTPKQLTRKQAVMKVKRWLSKPAVTPIIERKAKSLMYLFMIEAEELLEAGVSYENVCALQRHWLI